MSRERETMVNTSIYATCLYKITMSNTYRENDHATIPHKWSMHAFNHPLLSVLTLSSCVDSSCKLLKEYMGITLLDCTSDSSCKLLEGCMSVELLDCTSDSLAL